MKAYKDRNLKVKNEDDVFLFKGGIHYTVLPTLEYLMFDSV